MRKLKLFFACLLMAVLSIGQMWGSIDANSTWTATAFGDLPDGATVIMINNFGNSFANATVTKAPAKVAASFNSTTKKITVSTTGKSLDDIAWTVEQATNGTKFWVYGSTTNILGLSKTNDNNAVAVNTASNAQYNEFVMGANGKLLKYYNAGRYVGEYVSGSDWRSYNAENANNYKSGSTEQALTFYVLDAAPTDPFTVTLMDNSATLTEESAGAGVTLPSRDGCEGYTFVGWTNTWTAAQSSWTTEAPEIIPAGAYHPTADENLYPVYTKVEVSSGSGFTGYTQIAFGGTITDGQYLISTGSFTMAGSGKTGASFTPGSTEKTEYEYTISVDGDYFTILGPDNKYVGSGSGTGLIFDNSASEDTYKWEYVSTGILNKSNTTRHIKGYNTTDFRNYTTSNGTLTYLYKRTEGGSSSTTYYISEPSCCTKRAISIASGITNGSISADLTEACEGVTVTITFSPDGGYHLESWSVNGTAQNVNANTFLMPAAAATVSATFVHDDCVNLAKPTLDGVTKTYNSATIAWNTVTDAVAYAVSVVKDGEAEPVYSGNVTELSKALENLEPETQYNYTIMAIGDGTVKCADGNGLLEGNFTTNPLPTAVLTLMENGNEVAGGSHAITVPFALPTEVSHTCTKVFVGWDADPDCATAPTYAPGANFTFANTTGVTLYAVYAEAGDATYTKTAFADLASGDEVVITGDNGDMYAMSNDNGASNAPTAVEIAEASENVLNVTGKTNIFWIITKDGANFSFTVKGGTDKLYCTGDNNGVRVGTNTNNVFSINSGYMYNNGQSAYVGIYNSADWRRYSSINNNIKNQTFAFYKAVVAYSNYATTCVEALAVPTFNETAGTYNVAKTIVLSAAEGDIHYTTNGDDPDANSPIYSTAIVLDECGSTTIKAIAVDGARISEIAEATYVIKLPIDANTEEGAYTAAEAKAIIDEDCDLTSQQVYVKGTVQTPNYYESSHTYTITLAGEEGFQFYKLYDLNGAEFTSDYIKAGDQIVAYGYLKKHNATYELDQNCYLVSYEEYTEPKDDIDNTINDPYTVAQADAFMEDPVHYDLEDVVFVKGIVTGFATNKVIIRDTENGEEYIELYKSTLADGISALIEGDLIIATGTLNKYNNTTYQMNAGCQVVWKKAKATIEIADINMEVGDELALSSIAATITPDAAQSATISYEVTDGAAVTISEGKIIAEAAGEATITASIATTEDYIGASKEITVTVTAPDNRKIAILDAPYTALNGDLSSTDIKYATAQGGGTTAPAITAADKGSYIRLYKIASGNNYGGYITFNAVKGCKIDQVQITVGANASLAYCKDAETIPTSGAESVSKDAVFSTSTGLDAESVTVVNLSTSNAFDVAAIKVYYNGDPLAVHHYILGGTYEKTFEQNTEFSYEGLTVTAAYDELETITEPITDFTVVADLSEVGQATASVRRNNAEIATYNITITPGKANPNLAYTPNELEVAAADVASWVAPVFSNPFEVSPIIYSSNKTSVAKVTNAGVITLEGGYGTAVITASFAGNDDYIASQATYTITVNEPIDDIKGHWVAANAVEAGMEIIITSEAEANNVKSMGAQASSNRPGVASTINTSGVLSPATGTKIFTLVDAGDDLFAIKATNGNYLYASSNSSNQLKETSSYESNNNAKWSISINEGIATIQAQGSNGRNTMRYNPNNGSPLFACYAPENNMQDIVIYAISEEVKDGEVIDASSLREDEDIVINGNASMTINDEVSLGDIYVKDGQTLTIEASEDATLGNLDLENGAILDLDITPGATVAANDLILRSNSASAANQTTDAQPGKSSQAPVMPVVNGVLALEIDLRPDLGANEILDAEASSLWYCISAPFDVDINSGFEWVYPDGHRTAMIHNTDFQIFAYDGARRATGISGWKRTSGTMKAGVAHFIGFDNARTTNQKVIRLTAKTNTVSAATTIPLSLYEGSAENKNWNGVANPTLQYIGIDKDIVAFDYLAQDYNTYAYGDYNYAVGSPFFIQAVNTDPIGINHDTHGAVHAPKRADDRLEYCVRIQKSTSKGFEGQMYVRASETASNQYEAGHDMASQCSTTPKYSARIWSENYNMRLGIEEAPLTNGNASYILGIATPAAGEYTISVAAPKENATLYLTYNGSIIWNLSNGAYTIDLPKGITSGYGLVMQAKAPQVGTDIESQTAIVNGVEKVVINNTIYILRDQQMYDLTGKMVK